MKKILFVCLGNICRSPLAEGILLHLKEKKGLNLKVDSAGTAAYHIGEAPDTRTIKNALSHGVDLSALRARQFNRQDFEDFDYILVMDKNNLANVLRLAQNHEQKNKVELFLNFSMINDLEEVPDPYYGNEKDFEEVFRLVYQACESLCEKIK